MLEWKEVGFTRVGEGGLAAMLTPDRQTVLVTPEGIFVPPDEIISISPVVEKGRVLIYRNVSRPFCFVLSHRIKDKKTRKEDWLASFFHEANTALYGVYAYRRRVFPYSVPLVALRKAVVEFDLDTVMYVLQNIKETTLVGCD